MRILFLLMVAALLNGQPAPGVNPGEKSDPTKKARELAEAASQMTGSTPEIQVVALFHLAETYQALDRKKAKELFQQAFAAAAVLPKDRIHNRQREQARIVCAVADADVNEAIEMLRQMEPAPGMYDPRWPAVDKIVGKLVADSRLDEAIGLVEGIGSTGFYSFGAAAQVFKALPDGDSRRMTLFGSATSAYILRPTERFLIFLTNCWTGVPKQMAEAAMEAVLRTVLDQKDDGNYGARGYATAKGVVTFTSQQEAQLFEMMHIVRAINPKRAEEILETRQGLRAWVEQYPMGRKSIQAEGASYGFMSTGSDKQSVARSVDQGRSWLLTQNIAQSALNSVATDADKAVNLARSIPDAPRRAEVLGTIASRVAEQDSAWSKRLVNECSSLLDEIKNPDDRTPAWDAMADAAHRAGDDQLTWRVLDRALSDAAELAKKYVPGEDQDMTLREYWPSTQAYRRAVTRATEIFGVDAEPLLLKITDPDINLLARIAMAQALLGRPHTDWATRPPRRRR